MWGLFEVVPKEFDSKKQNVSCFTQRSVCVRVCVTEREQVRNVTRVMWVYLPTIYQALSMHYYESDLKERKS